MSEERRKDLICLIKLILSITRPFTLSDLYEEWKSIKEHKTLSETDIMLIKYVLSSMCDNGQVIYHEGAYNTYNYRKNDIAVAG